jgi:hypothetical protein
MASITEGAMVLIRDDVDVEGEVLKHYGVKCGKGGLAHVGSFGRVLRLSRVPFTMPGGKVSVHVYSPGGELHSWPLTVLKALPEPDFVRGSGILNLKTHGGIVHGEYVSMGLFREYGLVSIGHDEFLNVKYVVPAVGNVGASAVPGLDSVLEGLYDCMSGKRGDRDDLLARYRDLTGEERPRFMR